MTLPQVLHALGVDPAKLSSQQIEAMQFQQQCELLDRVASRTGWHGRQMLHQPISLVIEQIRLLGHRPPDPKTLENVIARYAKQD